MSIKNWILLSFFALLKLQTPFLLNKAYGFHRDELLYLALGRHLDFGFLEVPPMIALFASLIQNTVGESIWTVHLVSGLAGMALVILTGMIANEMGGKTFAILFSGFIIIFRLLFCVLTHFFSLWVGMFWAGRGLFISGFVISKPKKGVI